jgi:hypothetical protein
MRSPSQGVVGVSITCIVQLIGFFEHVLGHSQLVFSQYNHQNGYFKNNRANPSMTQADLPAAPEAKMGRE